MNKYRCLVVDDEPIAQRIIIKYLEDLPGFEVVDNCLNAIEAMSVLECNSIDLMFLDIEMPKLKGLAFLKTLSDPPHVIITTAHREYALEGFELEAVDYLLKPISFERFIKGINKFKKLQQPQTVSATIQNEKQDIIYIKSNRKTIKIQQSDILFIEGMNNYILIYTGEQKHIVYDSLSSILTKVNTSFIRIHKSYVVNRDKVTAFTKEQITIGDKELPVGNTYKNALKEL